MHRFEHDLDHHSFFKNNLSCLVDKEKIGKILES